MSQLIYLNGRLVPYEEAQVHVEDRGFVFADGIYEVIKCYDGRPFRMDAHLERLYQSAEEIRLSLPWSREELVRAIQETVGGNGLTGATAAIYLQATRGPAPRAHAFPANPRPTLFIFARPEKGPDPTLQQSGLKAITVDDRRWRMCHVKSVGLLLNTLAKQEALDAGAQEGLFVRDGIVTEGTASNAFFVQGGRLITHPEGPHILSGVTRQVVLELANELGIAADIRELPATELAHVEECFVTGTISEIMPIVSIDGRPVGQGKPGAVTRQLIDAFIRVTRGASAATQV